MAFMGGRIISPAIAGEFHKQGRDLKARVQPRVEVAFILLLIVAAPALALPGGAILAGILAVSAGALILFRLLRWQPWHCSSRPDLIGLCIGYAWLSLGLGLFGIAIATIARVAANLGISSNPIALLWLAALAWAMCFGTLTWLFAAELYRSWARSARD